MKVLGELQRALQDWWGCGLGHLHVNKLRGLWEGKDLPEGAEPERLQSAITLHAMLFPPCQGTGPMTSPDGEERLGLFSPDQDSSDGPLLFSFSLYPIPLPSLPSVGVDPKNSP